jgi:hypothetical protein
MELLHSAIQKNNFRSFPGPRHTPTKVIKSEETSETQWGFRLRYLDPPKLITAWLHLEDPLFQIAGGSYRASETRDRTFSLQTEALTTIKGHRKLSKVKMGDALGSAMPNEEQTRVIAGILYTCRGIQTVMYNSEKKSTWTYPEDLRIWSNKKQTIWIDNTCHTMLEATAKDLGKWISDRELEGWVIHWPNAEGSFDEVRGLLALEFPMLIVHPLEEGKKVKKDDYCRVLGKAQAIRVLAT